MNNHSQRWDFFAKTFIVNSKRQSDVDDIKRNILVFTMNIAVEKGSHK